MYVIFPNGPLFVFAAQIRCSRFGSI